MLDNINVINNYSDVKAKFYGKRLESISVSIMIPTYKRKILLNKAVKSVLLSRTNYSYEIVIVDNNPETKSEEVEEMLREFNDNRVSYYVNEKNIGMFGNWNRCIDYARGKWILVLNDDDYISSDYIETMMSYINRLPGCKAISCQHWYVDMEDSIIKGDYIKGNSKVIPIKMKDFYYFHPINIYGCMFDKETAIKLGGFDERFYPCCDAVLLMRICKEYGLYLCSDLLFYYRWAVNESQKLETQIGFADFQLLKAKLLNQKYHFYRNLGANVRVRLMKSFLLVQIDKVCDIDEITSAVIKEKYGKKTLKSIIGYYVYKFLRKIYKTLFIMRNNCINKTGR